MTDQNQTQGDRPEIWGGLRAESLEAHRRGDLKRAMSLALRAVIEDSMRWFGEAGIHFATPETDSALELLVGLASAARQIVNEKGDEAPLKLLIAASGLESAAAYRVALELPPGDDPDAVMNTLLRFVFLGMDLGRLDVMMGWTEAGLVDAFEARERDKERKRHGANLTNSAKATAKEGALAEALKVTATNPTLSNEELARRIQSNLKINTTIRTLTEWVRGWRRHGYFSKPVR